MSSPESTRGQFLKVGECLYRYSSTGEYYAPIKSKGKEVRRKLETKALAKVRLRVMRDQIDQMDLSAGSMTREVDPRLRSGRATSDSLWFR